MNKKVIWCEAISLVFHLKLALLEEGVAAMSNDFLYNLGLGSMEMRSSMSIAYRHMPRFGIASPC